MKVSILTFNPFSENTLILSDETGECVIVDPGMMSEDDNARFSGFIEEKGLKPVKILQTHLHLDHVFGLKYVTERYGLEAVAHKDDLHLIEMHRDYAYNFGIVVQSDPPCPTILIEEGDVVTFGNTQLKALHIPGHSLGSLAYYNEKDKILIAGDVLFRGSVGRTDLPGGDHGSLISGIINKLMILPDDVVVYPGHGPSTTIGEEKLHNPYL